MKFLIYLAWDERSVRQNASTCVEVVKHTEQPGRNGASDLGLGDCCLDLDI